MAPNISSENAIALIRKLYGLNVVNIKTLASYYDQNYHATVSEDWDNEHIKSINPHGYVFKILAPPTANISRIDIQNEIFDVLAAKDIPCPRVVLTKTGESRTNEYIIPLGGNSSDDTPQILYIYRMLIYIPGTPVSELPMTKDLLFEIGRQTANLHGVLKDYDHPCLYVNEQNMWVLDTAFRMKGHLCFVSDRQHRKLVQSILKALDDANLTLEGARKGTIHGDLNGGNILVNRKYDNNQNGNFGFIDFNDVTNSHYVWDLGVLIMHQMADCKVFNPLQVGRYIVSGYQTVKPLNKSEIDVLKLCVGIRFAFMMVVGEYDLSLDPENERILKLMIGGWAKLEQFWQCPQSELYEIWNI